MIEILQELLFRLRAGARSTLRWVVDRLTDRFQDRRFGIESAERRSCSSSSTDFMPYQPVSYRDMQELLAALEIGPQDVFLDIGSGMGRAVCVAAMRPFRSVIGIEISDELSELARRNIQRIRDKLICRDVRIVTANAVAFAIPPEVSVVFFFNPLGGTALRDVLANIAASVRAFPRALRIVFMGTISAERFRREAAKPQALVLQSDRILKTGTRALIYNVHSARLEPPDWQK
jgi:precorrin-6B methylase 2